MNLPIALVLGGSVVYLASSEAGALMIAAGCALEVVRWLDRFTGWRLIDRVPWRQE